MKRTTFLPCFCSVLVWLAGFTAAPIVAQRVIRVNPGALGANDGSSWANAYLLLQSALAAASNGDELWVAAGVHTPGPVGSRTATFQLKTGVRIYGGFAGSESNRAQRDPSSRETILSGDLSRNDQPNFINNAENKIGRAHV